MLSLALVGSDLDAPPLAEDVPVDKGASGSAIALFAGFAVTGELGFAGFLSANGAGLA
jgi:hypothetical protein